MTLSLCPLCIMISSLFFFMMLAPPSATLFPYTTLFRSRQDAFDRDVRSIGRGALDREPWEMLRHGIVQPQLAGVAKLQDRKSTRLNSSHVEISYAVFCLKKKKQKKTVRNYTNAMMANQS